MLKLTVNGEDLLVTQEVYHADYFGKVAHINHGWVQGEGEEAFSFPPADVHIFDTPDQAVLDAAALEHAQSGRFKPDSELPETAN
jgi:hypothetical protein